MSQAIRNNQIVVDLNKVQYADFCYVNQYGNRSYFRTPQKTVRGEPVGGHLALFHPNYPTETTEERATRLGLLDIWTSTLYIKLQANASLIYTGATRPSAVAAPLITSSWAKTKERIPTRHVQIGVDLRLNGSIVSTKAPSKRDRHRQERKASRAS
jgi:hypothetical protein